MNENQEFEKNWQLVSEEKDRLDDITDRRMWAGIERKIKKKKSGKKIYWVAAALIPLLAFVVVFKSITSVSEKSKVYVYETVGAGKTIVLPDSSMIELLPYSRLALDADFGKTGRGVTFTGKGNFNITKDKTKPFRINAGEFKVEVLGTQFFVDQQSAEKKVELLEGKVKVEYDNTVTYLLPEEVWMKGPEHISYHYYKPQKSKAFIFNRSAYSAVIVQLENTYNIKISYPERFKDKKVSGSFTGNLQEVLSVISFPFNLTQKKYSENEIVLK